MAVTLSQLVDLAIGADVPSVNFRYLRDVLITVVQVLDLSDVKTTTATSGDMISGDTEANGLVEDGTVSYREQNDIDNEGKHASLDAPSGNVEPNKESGDENKVLNDSNNNKGDENCENAATSVGTDAKTKEITTEQNIGRNSRKKGASNIPSTGSGSKAVSGPSSVLANKVRVLEEGLKSLRSIVGDLISRGDYSEETSDILLQQLRSAEKELEKIDTPAVIEDSGISPQNIEVAETGGQEVPRETRKGSSRISRQVSGKTTRPATQPARDGIGANTGKDGARGKPKSGVVNGGKQTPRHVSASTKAKERNAIGGSKNVARTNKAGTNGEVRGKSGVITKNTTLPPEIHQSPGVNANEKRDDDKVLVDDMNDGDPIESPIDPDDPLYDVRRELKQIEFWREKLTAVQEEFRSEIGSCKKAVQRIQSDLEGFKVAKNAHDAERFNAVHHVHNLVMELEDKHSKTLKTVHNLVDEFNRHDRTFNDVFNAIEKLDESKVDNVMLSSEVETKATKDDLRDKVSFSTFDETFSLLDRGLNDALEKMANQMSMEEALRETLGELESGMESKLNRDEMDKLKSELESRIKEVQAIQKEKGLEGNARVIGDPAGFKRKPEMVRCISCDRDMEIGTVPSHVPPSLPKVQRMTGNNVNKPMPSREGHVTKKPEESEPRSMKMKAEILQGTALHDFTSFPMSQRFCGGSHTIIRGKQRPQTNSHFNDYVVIRNDPNSVVTLPPREFILPKDSVMGSSFIKQKLPAIPETGGLMKAGEDMPGGLIEGGENKNTFLAKIPVCKNDSE